MKAMLVVLLVGGAVVAAVPSAGAGELQTLFDLAIRLGEGGFTLGGRVDGPRGPASGSINGRRTPGGFVVDGWVDDRGRTWRFELDADLRDGEMRAIVRRSPERI